MLNKLILSYCTAYYINCYPSITWSHPTLYHSVRYPGYFVPLTFPDTGDPTLSPIVSTNLCFSYEERWILGHWDPVYPQPTEPN